MQSHNEHKFHQFLKVLQKSKIYYICCGCRDIFIEAEQRLTSGLSMEDIQSDSPIEITSTPSADNKGRDNLIIH